MSNRDSRRRRPSVSSSSDDEDIFTHIQCWIPSQGIDLVVLATYLKEFIDDTATIKPSPNPQNSSKQGYTIGARNSLSIAGCRDIIEDSRYWEKEKQSRDYRREPYSFNESDTWHNRKKKGASPGHTNPRRRRRPLGESTDAPSRATELTRANRPGTTRHDRDPSPENPPRPGHPPPDMLSSKIPKPDLNQSMRKLSLADQEAVREQLRKSSITGNTTQTIANRSARMQQTSTSTSRHKDKVEDDIRTAAGTTNTAAKRDRHALVVDDDDDDDEMLSTISTSRRDRHGR